MVAIKLPIIINHIEQSGENTMSQAITRLEEISQAIASKLDVIQKESINVGELLIEAKEEFTGNGKNYKQFIEWCGASFNIGKAQASKLMKVATFFKDDERFSNKGIAMRVLYSLACNATEEQLERAAEFAANNSLTSAIVNQLLNPTPVEEEPKKEETKTKEELAEQETEIQVALNNVPSKEEKDAPAGEPSADTNLAQEVQELRSALAEANKLIASLKEGKSKKPELPLLPQFSSKCAYAVLGLSAEEAKQITKIKKAFRDLIKTGYKDNEEAFKILTEAKDKLLEELEASK